MFDAHEGQVSAIVCHENTLISVSEDDRSAKVLDLAAKGGDSEPVKVIMKGQLKWATRSSVGAGLVQVFTPA